MEISKVELSIPDMTSSIDTDGSPRGYPAILAQPTLQPSPSSTHSSGDTAVDSEIDLEEIAMNVRGALENLGLDTDDQHFSGTPMRVAKLLESFVQFREEDLGEVLATDFEETDDNILVVQTKIPFVGLCAHHLLPFTGTASVGYIPRKRVVGLSKLTRLTRAAGRVSPSTQEHVTNLIADTLHRTLEPVAAGAITVATHGCMDSRGVLTHGTLTKVSALRGQFLLNQDARKEFLQMALEN